MDKNPTLNVTYVIWDNAGDGVGYVEGVDATFTIEGEVFCFQGVYRHDCNMRFIKNVLDIKVPHNFVTFVFLNNVFDFYAESEYRTYPNRMRIML